MSPSAKILSAVLAVSAWSAEPPLRGPQPVQRAELSVDYLCAGGEYRWKVGDVSDDLGPALGVYTGASGAEFLYLSEVGYRVLMTGDRAGAEIEVVEKSSGKRTPLAALDPVENTCAVEGDEGLTRERIRLAPSVAATLEVRLRDGIFRPADCHRNVVTGNYNLPIWKVAVFRFPGRKVELKNLDGAVFASREGCRSYRDRLRGEQR